MIIVRLIGGLGNQLFQYAVARHLAEIHKTELKIDISGFETYKLHKYSLLPFNIQENFASPEEVAALKWHKQGIAEYVVRRVLRRTPKPALTYIREKKKFHFDPDILKLPDGIYLEGSWQSEKYFVDIAGIIRREFTVNMSPKGRDKKLSEEMKLCDSISLHIRRGDYVTNPGTNRIHGTCDLDYYRCCVERLASKVKHPHFFIFSDDPGWVRDNLKLPYPITFVDHNKADKNYEDLRLISKCKHHIIANSTFSWWGAWLGAHPGKMVYAPKHWVAATDVYDAREIVPDKWNKI